MGRQPCCDKVGLRRGPWTIEEDNKLMSFILNNGIQCWRLVPKLAGLMRCGKSCRLRWINYLRPDLKRGAWTEAEEDMIIHLHSQLGNRWSKIAAHFPGRTDNEIKNHWNTKIKKKLKHLGLDPLTHKPIMDQLGVGHDPHVRGFKNEEMAEYSSSLEEDTIKLESQESSSKESQIQNNDHQQGTSTLEKETNLLAGLFNEIKQCPGQMGRLDASQILMNDIQFQLEDPFQNWMNNPFPWDIFFNSAT